MGLLSIDRELTRLSYYEATAPRGAGFPALDAEVRADVAIVGAGLAGLCAAIELRDRGFDVVVLEARQVGSGASGRNGGQAIHGLACEIDAVEAELGLDEARRVWAMTIEALDLVRARCARFAIDCDWRDGFLGVAVNERKARALRAGVERLAARYHYPQTWIDQRDLPQWIASPRYVAAAHDARSGHLHPLKYTLGLARAAAGLGVRLFEASAARQLQRSGAGLQLRTERGAVRAQQVLLAGNVYLPALAPGLAPRLGQRIMPVGTYVGCSETLDPALAASLVPCGAAVCDNNFILDYFRPTADHRLLYGGGVSYTTLTPSNLAERMRRRMAETFPQLQGTQLDYVWGGFVDISMSRAPDFSRIEPNVYAVQGFSGHGLALTGLAGKLVAEAIEGDASRFDVFARLKHREFPGGALLRTPALALGTAYYRLKDLL